MLTLEQAIAERDKFEEKIPHYSPIELTDEQAAEIGSVGMFQINEGDLAGVVVSITRGEVDETQTFAVNYRAVRFDGSEIDYNKLDGIVMDIVEYMATVIAIQDMEAKTE